MKAIDLGLIQARRAKLDQEIAEHEKAVVDLRLQLTDLEVAERVFAQLALEAGDDESGQASLELPVDAERQPKKKRSKPPGLPTIPHMIFEALRHAHGLGAPGLDPAGMVSYIRGRYWPNAPTEAVGPIAWRLWSKDHTLEKNGSLYALPADARPKIEGNADPIVEEPPAKKLPPPRRREFPESLMYGVSSMALSGADTGKPRPN